MDTLLTGMPDIVQLVTTLLLLPPFIFLSFLIPYGLGKGLNHLFLGGRSFAGSYLLCSFIGGMGFFALVLMISGAALIQVFSASSAEWWYGHLYTVGSTGNTVGIIGSFAAGIFKGSFD